MIKNHNISHSDVSSLALWRSIAAHELTVADLRTLLKALGRLDIVGEPAWRLAKSGDAGAAIGVAIHVTMKKRGSPPVVDLAMTAVLYAALAGSSAAHDFLAHMLEKRGASALAESWRAANRAAALKAPPAQADARRETANVDPDTASMRG